MHTLNLGILAHVDAGKTSLTERLLHTVGVIDELGSVDDGSTQTDSLALERQRGITIKSAVVSFLVDDVTVNLIDTPGHPDFIAEVERVLSVLDGAVLVVSSVEGVQGQTRVLMRTLQRLHIPTLIFVNKIDRSGADDDRVLRDISERLTPAVVAMGSAARTWAPARQASPRTDRRTPASPRRLAEVLVDHNDALLAACVDDATTVSYDQLRDELAVQAKRGLVHPAFFGSAITGAGVDSLLAGITELLAVRPRAMRVVQPRAASSRWSAVRPGRRSRTCGCSRGPCGRGIDCSCPEAASGKVTAIRAFERGSVVQRDAVSAGQIGRLWGLADIQIGDTIGATPTASDAHHFAPPTLETVIAPRRPADKGALHTALAELAEQDPLINLRQDDVRQEIFVSLYGEVQKEVVQATLADDYGIDVTFRESTTICIERPRGTGAALETIAKEPNPFLATVGLRVDPAAPGTGVEFRLEIELGSLPLSFLTAIEETVRATLQQGIHGWQVTDCTVTLAQSGYWPRQSHSHGVFDKSMSSTAGDFRNLTPLVLISALTQAGTQVYEPMHHFFLEIPADALGPMLPVLDRLRAVPQTPAMHGSSWRLEGDIPAARVHELQQQLPALTRGEGVLESAFARYQPVRGTIPTRPRSDHNPLNRKEYLLHVQRRV